MNYNEYDSNGNKRSFDYSKLFTDKKYRSRLILLLYLIFFVIIIFMLRNTNNSYENNSNNAQKNENNNTEVNNKEENNYSEELESNFSLIDTNNYNFKYYMYFEDDTFVATGKRFSDKYDFTFEDGKDVIKYKADGKKVMAKDSKENSEYVSTNLPSYYIDFFDTEVLKEIINASTKTNDNSYFITNGDLINYIDESYSFKLGAKEKAKTNEIKLKMKNNRIIEIEMDISNLLKSNAKEKQKKLKIVLKYSNFELIDDFDVIFDEKS